MCAEGSCRCRYELLTRTADGNEGGRHQLLTATVGNGNLYICKVQIGDKRWFKGEVYQQAGYADRLACQNGHGVTGSLDLISMLHCALQVPRSLARAQSTHSWWLELAGDDDSRARYTHVLGVSRSPTLVASAQRDEARLSQNKSDGPRLARVRLVGKMCGPGTVRLTQ